MSEIIKKAGVIKEVKLESGEKLYSMALFADKLDSLSVDAKGNVNLSVVRDATDKTKLQLVENTFFTTGVAVPKGFVNLSLRKEDVLKCATNQNYINLSVKENRNSTQTVKEYSVYQKTMDNDVKNILVGKAFVQRSQSIGIVYPVVNDKLNTVFYNAYLNKDTLLELEKNKKGNIYIAILPNSDGKTLQPVPSLSKETLTEKPLHLLTLNQDKLITLVPNEQGNIKLTYTPMMEASIKKDGPDMVIYDTDAFKNDKVKNWLGGARSQKAMYWLKTEQNIKLDISQNADFKVGSFVSYLEKEDKQLNLMMGKGEHTVQGEITSIVEGKVYVNSPIGNKEIEISKLSVSTNDNYQSFKMIVDSQSKNLNKGNKKEASKLKETVKTKSKENKKNNELNI